MQELRIVKSPTCIKGKTFKFGAIYGKIDGIIYVIERFEREECKNGILTFEFYREREIIHTKKHGDYERGGYWQKCVSIASGKYANIVKKVLRYLVYNPHMFTKQPTPYVRNVEIRSNGAPKRKEAQNELVFRVANVGYAISPHITTENDAVYRIRPGVIYNQWS